MRHYDGPEIPISHLGHRVILLMPNPFTRTKDSHMRCKVCGKVELAKNQRRRTKRGYCTDCREDLG